MKLGQKLDRGVADLTRVVLALPEVEKVMRLSLPGTKGHPYDTEGKQAVIWCEEHGREVRSCHKQDLRCTGAPDRALSDPTGDAATDVRLYADLREAHKRAERIIADGDWFIGFVNRYRDADATPQRDRELEDTNKPPCERHLRFGYERQARSPRGSKVKREDGTSVFADLHRLCDFCTGIALDFGRLPTQQEIQANVDGRRIRRPA